MAVPRGQTACTEYSVGSAGKCDRWTTALLNTIAVPRGQTARTGQETHVACRRRLPQESWLTYPRLLYTQACVTGLCYGYRGNLR